MKQKLAYTIVFTFIFSFLFVFILAFVNQSTAAFVSQNKELLYQRAVLGAVGISFSSDEDALQKYELITIDRVDGTEVYSAVLDNEVVFAKQFTGAGLWGTITGVLAVNQDVSKIIGLRFMAHNETPGLGGRIEEEWFQAQFTDELIKNHSLRVGKSKSGDLGDADKTNAQIDAITGATRTSDAIRVILNTELPKLAEMIGGLQ